jgi:nucleolar complex protein 3
MKYNYRPVTFFKLVPLIQLMLFYVIFLQTFPKTDLLLDNESQGSGVFLPELDEPEYCNAQNTALWELHMLRVRAAL